MGYTVMDNKCNTCLECGTEIYNGRTDKKFCCEKCKNSFNNRKTSNSRVMRLRVRRSIERNYDILDRLIKMNVKTIDLSDLNMLGFNPEYVTFHRKSRGHDEFGCFDIRYVKTQNRIFSLSRFSTV